VVTRTPGLASNHFDLVPQSGIQIFLGERRSHHPPGQAKDTEHDDENNGGDQDQDQYRSELASFSTALTLLHPAHSETRRQVGQSVES